MAKQVVLALILERERERKGKPISPGAIEEKSTEVWQPWEPSSPQVPVTETQSGSPFWR